MSNRWSRRRSVIKRPPVCKSPPVPEKVFQPTRLRANIGWLITDGIHFSSASVAGLLLANTPGTNIWDGNFLSATFEHCTIQVLLGNAPATSAVYILITDGPLAGTSFVGITAGWDGNTTWLSAGNVLACSIPTQTALLDLFTP